MLTSRPTLVSVSSFLFLLALSLQVQLQQTGCVVTAFSMSAASNGNTNGNTAVTTAQVPVDATPTKNHRGAFDFSTFQLNALQEAGVMGVQRPFTIVAEAISASQSSEKTTSTMHDHHMHLATKVIHFQRHGQGYHNLIGEMYGELLGRSINIDCPDPSQNPFIREETLDSPLTEKGRLECAARRTQAAQLKPQVIIVSPLHRAIQTSMLSFADHASTIKWIAHEGAREQLGWLMCNKRRPLASTKLEFPNVDFSEMLFTEDEDVLWHPSERESPAAETDRIYKFLTEFIMDRPEQELAVVGHSAWLFTMCNAVVDCGDDDVLKSLFQTSEIRSMKLSFYRTPEVEAQ
jgi:broad specificity phosphatase PhoE